MHIWFIYSHRAAGNTSSKTASLFDRGVNWISPLRTRKQRRSGNFKFFFTVLREGQGILIENDGLPLFNRIETECNFLSGGGKNFFSAILKTIKIIIQLSYSSIRILVRYLTFLYSKHVVIAYRWRCIHMYSWFIHLQINLRWSNNY